METVEVWKGRRVVRLTVDAEMPYVTGRLYVNGGEDATLVSFRAKTLQRAYVLAAKALDARAAGL